MKKHIVFVIAILAAFLVAGSATAQTCNFGISGLVQSCIDEGALTGIQGPAGADGADGAASTRH